MGVDKLIKYALGVALAYSTYGALAAANFDLAKKVSHAMQYEQLSYGKFNRMLQSPKKKSSRTRELFRPSP